jgi:hypothetical protein
MKRKLTARLFLPVLKAFQGHPVAGALRKAHQQAPRRPRYRAHQTRANYLSGYDRREGRPSVPTSDREELAVHSQLLDASEQKHGSTRDGNRFTRDDAGPKVLLRKFERYSNEGHFDAEVSMLSANLLDWVDN